MIESQVKALGQSSRGVRDSPFLMSGLRCPTAYCELGFLDNPADYKQFDTPQKQRLFAAAYAKGVLAFLGIRWQTPRGYTIKDGRKCRKLKPRKSALLQYKWTDTSNKQIS